MIAHLHPLLVHLPIGILLLALLFQRMADTERFQSLRPVLPWLFTSGAVASVLSCISGWLLASSGDYDPDTLFWHRWLGILTASCAVGCAVFPLKSLSAVTALALVCAGHHGGALTHGSDFLTLKPAEETKRPADPGQADIYRDVVSVILNEKCISCHGSGKQKGGLRLDNHADILRGGDSGTAVQPGQPEKSELIRRCQLPEGHEEHMPPKGKPALTSAELEILQWWIGQGTPVNLSVQAASPAPPIRKLVEQWCSSGIEKMPEISEIPDGNPPAASPALVLRLIRAGVSVTPVSSSSSWLRASLVNLPQPADSVMAMLTELSPQLLMLDLGKCRISESSLTMLSYFTQLTRLSLAGTNVTDNDLSSLTAMNKLRVLNLSATTVTAAGLRVLTSLRNLRTVYLDRTGISPADWPSMPGVRFDSGGYRLPVLPSDTTRLTEDAR
jgi:mono/diheme cytochrome c family protein